MNITNRIELHKRFWNGDLLDKIPVSFRLGNLFFAVDFKAAKHLLKHRLKIEPYMLNVDDFMEDYDRMFIETERIGQAGFWTAEPFTAIPWLEAMMGCPVYAGEKSFVTEPVTDSSSILTNPAEIELNAWFLKYMEFAEKLVKLSAGRFPIGQPITRGISDTIGAVFGQEQMVYKLYDSPEEISHFAGLITDIFLKLIRSHYSVVPEFSGGYSIGFYHVWCPDRCIWFQEDLTSILSPLHYRQYIQQLNAKVCRQYKFSAMHLHASSFHMLDDILGLEDLKALEVNKDIGGPSIHDMMPVFRKILDTNKCLIIWGPLDEADMEIIKSELLPRRIFLHIIAESREKAEKLLSCL